MKTESILVNFKLFIFVLMLINTSTILAQEPSFIDQFKGEWVLDRVELYEAPLDNLEKATTKVYTTIPNGEKHFLLHYSIVKMIIPIDDNLDNAYFETGDKVIKNFMLEQDQETMLLVIRDLNDSPGDHPLEYNFEFLSEDSLVLKTLEVFYNNSDTAMKASLTIYLKKVQ